VVEKKKLTSLKKEGIKPIEFKSEVTYFAEIKAIELPSVI
jgi:hypothetical protein